MKSRKLTFVVAMLLGLLPASAQLAVHVSPVKMTGQKAVVTLGLKNAFAEKVESARAVCFLLNEQGKMIAQSTKWVIGGTKPKQDLPPGASTTFNFVIPMEDVVSTNLNARVSFSRLILEGGKVADPRKEVTIEGTTK